MKRKYLLKRGMSILLASAMLVTSVPVTAMGAGIDEVRVEGEVQDDGQENAAIQEDADVAPQEEKEDTLLQEGNSVIEEEVTDPEEDTSVNGEEESIPEAVNAGGEEETLGASQSGDVLLADFDFDDEAAPLQGGNAVAQGDYSLVDYNEGKALQLDGNGQYLAVTNADGSSLLTDKEVITISYDAMYMRNNTNWIFFAANNANPQKYAEERYLGGLYSGGKFTVERYNTGSRAPSITVDLTNEWAHVDVVAQENVTRVFVDGVLLGTKDSKFRLSEIMEQNSIFQIGKANWGNGEFCHATIDNFRVYDGVKSGLKEAIVEEVKTGLDIGDISAVEKDLNLPAESKGVAISWRSDNEDIITSEGVVNRPEADTQVCLTAELTLGDIVETRDFHVTVRGVNVEGFAEQLTLPYSTEPGKEVYGNITLPMTVAKGSKTTVTWATSHPEIVNVNEIPNTGVYTEDPTPAGTVTRPDADTDVTMTATITYMGKTATKDFTFTVKAAPSQLQESDYTDYFFPYFTGEGLSNGEQIYFAASHDGLNWRDLNNNQLAITSTLGEQGLRDPFILRSPEGDKFYMIATDLKIYGNNDWTAAQRAGSQSLMVWESTDLVNWSDQRMVEVSAGIEAGCTWAPEATYDEATGEYVVYWASKVAEDNYSKQRLYYSKTRDFYTFTEPKLFIEKSHSTIDTTILKENGNYYRYSKNEDNGAKYVFAEKTPSLLHTDPVAIDSPVLVSQKGVEGPSILKFNQDDVEDNGYQYCLLLDNFGSGGYYPMVSNDLEGDFEKFTGSYQMPGGGKTPRHGTPVRITAQEYAAVMNAYNGGNETLTGITVDGKRLPAFAPSVTEYERPYTGALPVVAGKAPNGVDVEVTQATIENPIATVTASMNGDRPTTYTIRFVPRKTGILAEYDFRNIEEVNGETIIKDSTAYGYDAKLKGEGATYADGDLMLPGGDKGSKAAYVEIPKDVFVNQDTLTITLWLKNLTGSGDFSAMYFGTTTKHIGGGSANMPLNYWLLNPAKNGCFKSVWTDANNAGTPYSTETPASTTKTSSEWAMYTTVITPDSIKGYYNGQEVSSAQKTKTTSDFGSDLVAFIGRSAYDDLFYKGGVRGVKVSSDAMSPKEIWEEYYDTAEDGTALAEAALQADRDDLVLGDTSAVRTDLDLPKLGAKGSVITWESNKASIIDSQGKVTRPEDEDALVEMTATLTLKGSKLQKTFDVTVIAANAQNKLAEMMEKLSLDVVRTAKDIQLPATAGENTSIKWTTSNKAALTDKGKVTRPAKGKDDVKVTLTARVTYDDGQEKLTADKKFSVIVLAEEYGYLMAYTNSEERVDLGNSLHLAYSTDGSEYTALNSNTGICFANNKGGSKNNNPNVLTSTFIFKKADGTYGLMATNGNSNKYVYVFDSVDLVNFTNERKLTLSDKTNVRNPQCSYDETAEEYVIRWTNGSKKYKSTTKDLEKLENTVEEAYTPETVTAGVKPEGAVPGNVLEVSKNEYDTVVNKLGVVKNIGIEGVSKSLSLNLDNGADLSKIIPATVSASYTDGSAASLPVQWNAQELAKVNTTKAGTYTVSGTVGQTEYANPFIEQRADPCILKGDDGYYYFTASYPMLGGGDRDGYDKIILRRSKTIAGLTDADEITIWDCDETTGQYRYIWAPEIRYINGDYYIYYTASVESNNVWGIRPHVLKCENAQDIMNPASWVEKGAFQAVATDGKAFTNFSLDMTYFENKGHHYAVWAQTDGYSSLFMAEIDPNEPWKCISDSVKISVPEYSWERVVENVDEGPSVLKKNGKIFMAFSAAGTGPEYCVGLLTADEDADLLDAESWVKTGYPVLTSADVTGEYGPGHNSFTVDENGNDIFVYHARGEACYNDQCQWAREGSLYDPCRDARIKRVHWAADGTPILKMSYSEELADEFKNVKMTITVKAKPQAPISLGKTTGVKLTSTATAVKVSWNKQAKADGYEVYRYNTKAKKYTKVDTVKGTSYTARKLTTATAYRFMVRAYKKADKTYYGAYSDKKVIMTKPSTPKGVKAKRTTRVSAKSKAVISFKTVSRASEYYISKYNKKAKKYTIAYKVKNKKLYKYNAKTGKYKKVNNVKMKKGVVTCTLTKLNLKAEKSMRFKVRAARSKTGYTRQYSGYSKKLIVK